MKIKGVKLVRCAETSLKVPKQYRCIRAKNNIMSFLKKVGEKKKTCGDSFVFSEFMLDEFL